jgi:phospholipid/cholesterol/gamma-HCH transport system substrate-binding protein
MRNLRREAKWLWVIAVIMVIAGACAVYLLSNQRVTNPFDNSYTIKAEFQNASATAPGLGAAVNVAGVKVGQISSVELRNGRGLLGLAIDPGKLAHVYRGATARLVPNTPLKDMQVDLVPGDAAAGAMREGDTIAIADTESPIDSDELLHALDSDTREYLRLLISDTGAGLEHRGADLRALLKTLGPTSAQVREIAALLKTRRTVVPRLVHNLQVLSTAAGGEDDSIRRIVSAGNATLGALASQDGALRTSISELPGTLRVARTTLAKASPFARSLRRTLTDLEPAVPRLRQTLQDTPDALKGFLPLPLKQLKQFTDATVPLAPLVRSAAANIGGSLTPLALAFRAIGDTTNMLGYNPGTNTDSYLFWLAWFAHNSNSMISTADANGSVWRGFALFSCASFSGTGPTGELLKTVLGSASVCPPGAGG